MGAFYFLDIEVQSDGKHLVHTYACEMKKKLFPIKLGWQRNSKRALRIANKYYRHVKLCENCTKRTLKEIAQMYS